MELLTLEKIAKIALYERGEYIDFPHKQYYVGHTVIEGIHATVRISRRALKHIIEKGDIGVSLAFNVRTIVMLSTVIVRDFQNARRYFVFEVIGEHIYAVIIDTTEIPYSVITAMIVGTNYIKKHFPHVSVK